MKALLIVDGYDLKEEYGKEVLITINIPVESADGKIKGYQFHSTKSATLKAMPEKLEIPPIPKGILKTVWEKEKHKREGWNMCVDEILREE